MYKQFVASSKDLTVENLSSFINTVAPDRWDDFSIESGVLLDFPLHTMIPFLEQFISHPYRVDALEFTKLIYFLWPRYMNTSYADHNLTYPHNKIYEILYTVVQKLNEFKTITQNEVMQKGMKLHGSRYYNWHLFGILPLLKNQGMDVLENIYKLNYDDAQDMLMFALYHYEPKTFHQKLKEILVYWHQNGNISFSVGTGMISELQCILQKYKQFPAYDLTKDKQLFEIFEQYGVLKE